MAKRVWIISELYYPEDTSTGFIITKIAEGISARYAVSVICSQPTYAKRGTRVAKRESRNHVDIFRCWGTLLNKDILVLRLINLLTITLSMWWALLWRVRANDRVITVTN